MPRFWLRLPTPLRAKYSDDQPRVPAGNSDGGQWTRDGGGGGNVRGGADDANGRIRIAQAAPSGYPVDLLEEENLGGHTFAEHIGKREEYLIGRITGNRPSAPYIFGVGQKRAGSFVSLESANKLVNSVLSEPMNQAKLEAFTKGNFLYSLPVLYLYPSQTFTAPTGYEAYAPDDRTRPIIRSTYSVEVRILRTNKNPRGYYVNSVYPINED